MAEEKKGLSKREKRLLFVTLVIALMAGMVQFVYLPFNSSLTEGRNTLGELESQKMQIGLRLAMEQSVRQSHADTLARFDEISSELLSRSQSNEIGRMLTTLCEKHGFMPISQRLTDPERYILVTHNEDPATGAVTQAREETTLLTVSVNMSVKGEYGQLMNLLDEVDEITYIRVSRVSFTREAQPPHDVNTVVIDFMVTMMDGVPG